MRPWFVPLFAWSTLCAGVPMTPAGPPEPTTMRAVRFHRFGGPEVLAYETAPRPQPELGELLVEVHAAGVNPVDWKARNGALQGIHPELPQIPGFDVAGKVVRVREGSHFKVGDEIFAFVSLARGGAYAEYAIVRDDEAAPKPRNATYVQAASLPLAALTAWQALFDTAHLAAGQTVLIHGAAGGVGSLAVQLAKGKGARVIGTASASNHAFLRSLGADELIDYHAQRFEAVVHDVDVVLDTVGGDTLERSFQVVKPGGTIVSIAGRPSDSLAREKSVHALSVLVHPAADELRALAALVEDGKLRPIVSRVFPLKKARAAQEASQTGHTRGKLVLAVRE